MSNNTGSTAESKESIAKKIWLAGLGAYGQGFEDAVEQYKQANDKTSKLFSDLVKKGAALEVITRNKFEEARSQSNANFEQRVSSVRKKLGLNDSDDEARLERLEAKIDALTDVVNSLIEKKPARKTTKPAEK